MSGVVIGVGAAIGAVMGGGSSIISMKKANKSQIKAFKKQMEYLQKNYNYNQAALDRQERSLYDGAMVELFQLSMNSFQNNAQIEAALAETGVEGRSQEKIGQVTRGQTSRQETSIKEAHEAEVWDVRGQKDALYIQTRAEVEQARDQLKGNLIGGSQAFMQFLGSAAQGAAMGAATAGIGSAVGGALAGGTASTFAPAVGGAAATPAVAPTAATALTTTETAALTTGASGSLGSVLQSGVQSARPAAAMSRIGDAATHSAFAKGGTGFWDRFLTSYDQQSKYLKFWNQVGQIGDYWSRQSARTRGGYYY